ncbi:polysaccharide export outer membrane protein [Rhodovulum bhavnagarense]|uniref:Polysaccharide export outer membrane protein n=1 Tax=Rhodovulum bhavnagarense TaxID=992286 RepID=A0A4R2RGQ6_9RHOB|nr:polysaccharide biosynthesis/export family protein [Rhodovulum bhavnagarense]TCP58355.1 polysaccharide export outer membrane protein [Rhodovulum bhavnagarense]
MNIRQVRKLHVTGVLVSSLVLVSCTAMPRNGPSAADVISAASARAKNDEATLGYEYAIVDVTRGMLPFISSDDASSFASFGAASSTPPEIRLGVGDVIQLTIFESQAGGLFIPREAGARPGNYVQLPPQEIGRNGKITVPYAGEVTAAGQTIELLEKNIEDRLEDQAIEPQVTIQFVEKNFPRVSVVGTVSEPGNYTLRNSGDRVLDVIARAGGLTSPEYNSFVSLTRGGASARIAYEALTSNPRENIFVAPADTINVTSELKKFYVFGATGVVGEFDFNESELFLRTAMGFAAGLVDGQADPADVLVYRKEVPDALERMGVDVSNILALDDGVPTVYKVDFRKPDSFFLASEFRVRDGDVIYVSNAESVEIAKFFNLATTVTGGTTQIDADINALTD